MRPQPKNPRPDANPFRARPSLIHEPAVRAGRNQEETYRMVTGLIVIGALLVGACSLHLMRRYRSRS
ncbi:hypothetical protein SAMN05421806_104374 [Streptomyces indicus]|uniref:Uncharacterized protein n=1 Tax=Streptomyces indicus TaxID=417292 RepID=A0A1G8Z2Z4_9ACTN|nr:hypothetical protein SAMN05421806_104374 [Streptomyces indicus]